MTSFFQFFSDNPGIGWFCFGFLVGFVLNSITLRIVNHDNK